MRQTETSWLKSYDVEGVFSTALLAVEGSFVMSIPRLVRNLRERNS
jgi:hypothetical protein